MKSKGILFLAALVLLAPLAIGAEPQPDVYKIQADNESLAAMRLEKQAVLILQSGPMNREKLEMALKLLIEAGQLFEKASNAYKAGGINFESSQNSNNALQAMQGCLAMIKKIRAQLESGNPQLR